MSDKLKDILSTLSTEIDQELLLQYLQGRLSGEKAHEVEKQLLQGEFEADALEGLEAFRDKEQLAYMVEMLHRDLKKKTEQKKKRREKLRLPDQRWIIFSVILLLLLIVLSYFVVTRLLQP